MEKTMTTFIDKVYFQELSELNPINVCTRALCSYDDTDRFFSLSVWGKPYRIYPHQFKIKSSMENHDKFQPYFDLFALHYLLGAKETELAGQWISEKDIPGGSTFFRGPHEIPTHLITSRFTGNIKEFKTKGEQLSGASLGLADAAFAFKITPRIPAAVLFWEGDDEFPAEAKILFDRTIAQHLSSDIIWALAVGICEKLSKSTN
jgi:hypothetical protein